jgi:hypothetical protein
MIFQEQVSCGLGPAAPAQLLQVRRLRDRRSRDGNDNPGNIFGDTSGRNRAAVDPQTPAMETAEGSGGR